MLAARIKILRGLKLALLLTAIAAADVVVAQQDPTLTLPADSETRALLQRAEALIAAGDGNDAYLLLAGHETELAGNVMFDYLLGVAALDSGRPGDAIFALRRALSVEPRFSGARMELARAYFEAGSPELARPLFVRLLGEDPPAGVRDVIDRYIRAIDARPAAPRPRFTPYAELTAGWDSNANGSTDDRQFLGFTLSPDNVESDSAFGDVAAGFGWLAPVSNRFAWQLGARASHRHNPDASFVDSTLLGGIGGFGWRRGSWFGRAALDAYQAWRDGESNQSYAGADLHAGRRFSAAWEISIGVRGGVLRHDDAIDVLDVARVLYTLGIARRFGASGRLALELVGGSDDEDQAGSPYGNAKSGVRLSATAPLGRHFLHASLGSLTTDYDGLFFGAAREDEQLSALLQLEFRDIGIDGLSLLPRLRYSDNDSDISLYRYDRTEIGVGIRWSPP